MNTEEVPKVTRSRSKKIEVPVVVEKVPEPIKKVKKEKAERTPAEVEAAREKMALVRSKKGTKPKA